LAVVCFGEIRAVRPNLAARRGGMGGSTTASITCLSFGVPAAERLLQPVPAGNQKGGRDRALWKSR
jgi:hypothetical protein